MASGGFSNPASSSTDKDKSYPTKPRLLSDECDGAREDNVSLFSLRNNAPPTPIGEGFGFGGGAPFHYMWYDNRLQSFYNWPVSHPMKAESLAGAGFYYTGYSDKVRCFWCSTCLHQWEVFDSPLEQHKKHSKGNCNFLKIYFPLK